MDEAFIGIGLAILYGIGIFFLIIYSHRSYRQRKLMESLPTSKVDGVFIGFVEVKGSAECHTSLIGFLSQSPCIYYSYKVEERWSKTEVVTSFSNGKATTRVKQTSGDTVIESDENMIDFYLIDDTGALLIHPRGARIEGIKTFHKTVRPDDSLYYSKGPRESIPHSVHIRTFTEYAIPQHYPIYILGQAQERDDCVAPEITQSNKAAHYLISTKSEEELISRHRKKAWMFILLGLIMSCAPFIYIYTQDIADWHPFLYSTLIYCFIWITSWTWITYNFLIEHRNRVRQAISLIDIQLQRRYDLIPQLCTILSAYSEYEQSLFTHIAELRRLQAINEPSMPTITMLQEQYPQLTADALFLQVQREISNTENRIALSRDYYNSILKHFHNNIQKFPECLLSGKLGFREFPALAMDRFSRSNPSVNFNP